MTHEPECNPGYPVAKDQYVIRQQCICDALRAAYRRGYNAHATAAQHWRDTHGAYQQHGAGENP